MDAGTGTFIAAGIAAATSSVSLLTNVLASRRAEMRTAHRKLLHPVLESLGTAQHEIIATSAIIRKRRRQNQDPSKWIESGDEAKELLMTARFRVRYPLWGLDDAFRTLTRLPEWTATYKNIDDGTAEALLDASRRLVVLTDQAIRRSYKRGLPPGWYERRRASRQVKRVRDAWERRFQPQSLRWWNVWRRLQLVRRPRPAPELSDA